MLWSESWKRAIQAQRQCMNMGNVPMFLTPFMHWTDTVIILMIFVKYLEFVFNGLTFFRARGIVVVKALCYKPEGLGSETGWSEFIFSIYLIIPAAVGPGVYSASWVAEAEKQWFWGVEQGLCVGLTTLSPSVSRLSRQCGILNMSQPYRSPRPVTGTAQLHGLKC
jgi:hypothetical protein